MKYKCKKCKKEKSILKGTIGIFDDKVICKQAFCCGEYMKDVEEEFNGFPTIHTNQNTHEDIIIQHKAKQKEARLKKDGYDKNEPND